MGIAQLENDYASQSYRAYISALSATDNVYQNLHRFLDSSPDTFESGYILRGTQIGRDGGVMIMDNVGGKLDMQHYPFGKAGGNEEYMKRCMRCLQESPQPAETRIILVNYHRDALTGDYSGVNTDVLDAVAWKYKIHPEVLMWHFGSDYGLDRRFFPLTTTPIPSALSNRRYCHLRNQHSLLSTFLHLSEHPGEGDAVIFFARDYEFPNWDLLTSRLRFRDSLFPTAPSKPQTRSCWSNTLFIDALHDLPIDQALTCGKNPIEFLIPYAQMVLINITFVTDAWARKVMHTHNKTSANLEIHYDKQLSVLDEIRFNLDTLNDFTVTASSPKWNRLIRDYERALRRTEQQIHVLSQKMTYRAAMASLDESKLGIEHAKTGNEQSARVRRLTQLAFIFIPLSFSTSLFGMNLDILGSGTARAWMVFVAVVSVYTATSLVWMTLHYGNAVEAWVAARLQG